MLKTLVFLAVGLAVGFAVAQWSSRDSFERDRAPLANAGAEQRLDALESALAAERRARIALESQVTAVEERVTSLGGAAVEPGTERVEAEDDADREQNPDAAEQGPFAALTGRFPEPVRERLNTALRARGSFEDRMSLFVDAGFTPDRAQWIVDRTESLRMQVLQERYEAERSGEPLEPGAPLLSAEERLRNELGDADYERYLDALGRPSSVWVNDVLGSSPASQAGLLPGDEIVAYGGERVFDMSDLNRLTYEGEPGELVAIDARRDGQPVQIYVPRGPIGITGSGRFRRR